MDQLRFLVFQDKSFIIIIITATTVGFATLVYLEETVHKSGSCCFASTFCTTTHWSIL